MQKAPTGKFSQAGSQRTSGPAHGFLPSAPNAPGATLHAPASPRRGPPTHPSTDRPTDRPPTPVPALHPLSPPARPQPQGKGSLPKRWRREGPRGSGWGGQAAAVDGAGSRGRGAALAHSLTPLAARHCARAAGVHSARQPRCVTSAARVTWAPPLAAASASAVAVSGCPVNAFVLGSAWARSALLATAHRAPRAGCRAGGRVCGCVCVCDAQSTRAAAELLAELRVLTCGALTPGGWPGKGSGRERRHLAVAPSAQAQKTSVVERVMWFDCIEAPSGQNEGRIQCSVGSSSRVAYRLSHQLTREGPFWKGYESPGCCMSSVVCFLQ